jgi:integrase
MRLDNRTVAALDLGNKNDVIHFDSEMTGFGYRLRRGAGGKVLKTWVVQYRRAGGSRRMLLGPASVLSAEQARKEAKKALGRVAIGEDPQAVRADRRDKDRTKVKAVIDEFLAAKASEVRPATLRGLRLFLAGGYFKPLHGMPVDKVTRADVASRLVAIQRQHTPIIASRCRAALSAFYVWAMRMGIVESNPVTGTLQPRDSQPRERVLSDAELAAIWRASGGDDYGRIVKLLVLAACRRGEIGGMCWSEINFNAGSWVLPAARSKNGRAHALPLTPTALEIIATVPRRVSRDQLFGYGKAGFCDWDNAKHDLDARSGVIDWTLHDIRRSVATRMGDLGVQPHIVETVLNHQSGHRRGTAGTYNRSSYEREVRAALALWEDHIRSIVAGGERKVLPFTSQSAS